MKSYLLAISALALPLFAFDAAAQAWPTKPLRAIVPVGAGSSTDIVHRFALIEYFARANAIEARVPRSMRDQLLSKTGSDSYPST